MSNGKPWELFTPLHEDSTHVVPIDDSRTHVLSRGCWCKPQTDEPYQRVFVHHSDDGRERSGDAERLALWNARPPADGDEDD